MALIKINETRNIDSIIIGRDILDAHRHYRKHITFLGITIWRRDYRHDLDYKVDNLSPVKKPGFIQKSNNEETKRNE